MNHKTLLLSTVFASSLCLAGRMDIAPEGNKVTVPGLITLYASWVKDKGEKYDVGFHFKNESESNFIIQLKEAHCYRGKTIGELKDDKTLALRSGQMKEQSLTCVVPDKSGEYSVTIGKIYENPTGDGKTLGKVLAKEVKWQVTLAQ